MIRKPDYKIEIEALSAWYDGLRALKSITMGIRNNSVTAIIGPSGCGKSTFIRCLNRMHELVRGARVEGNVSLDGQNVYERSVDPATIRRKIGMVFQKPNPFPTMSIYDNAVAGLKLNGVKDKGTLSEAAEKSLRSAFLWDEVKDELKKSGSELSGG